MNANELADELENLFHRFLHPHSKFQDFLNAATMLRQQQAEIEALKNANRFIQNFAQEQHQRTVALEMRELTDEEIKEVLTKFCHYGVLAKDDYFNFAKAILRKAQEK